MSFKDYKKRILDLDSELKDLYEDQSLEFGVEVANLITNIRIEKGLTQKALADLLGTHQSAIARIESGSHLPTLTILKKISEVVNEKLLPPQWDFMKKKKEQDASWSEKSATFDFIEGSSGGMVSASASAENFSVLQ